MSELKDYSMFSRHFFEPALQGQCDTPCDIVQLGGDLSQFRFGFSMAWQPVSTTMLKPGFGVARCLVPL